MGVGKSICRVDAADKAAGLAMYVGDLEPKDVLVAKVVRSTIANGVVKSFDLTEALKVKGIVKIITCFDVPKHQFPTPGHPWSTQINHQDIADRRLLNTRVRMYGDDIAAVVAESDIAAKRACRLIKVIYEEYEPLLTVHDAMKQIENPIHEENPNNILRQSSFTLGDTPYEEVKKEKGLFLLSKEYDTQPVQHCHIEVVHSFAYMEQGRIVVVSSTQIPHIVRRVIGQALNIPWGEIRVIKPYIGGGFGNKQDVLYEPLNAYLTKILGGRCVKIELTREETMACTRCRHGINYQLQAAIRQDGTLVGRTFKGYSNQGSYASHGHGIVANGANVFKQMYRDEKILETECFTVYTNRTTAGAMRGYGIPQVDFAMEAMIDDLAIGIKMDPLELRLKNCIKPGYIDPHTKIEYRGDGLRLCIEKGKELIGWNEKRASYQNQTGDKRKGIGMAIFTYKTGVYPVSLETSSCRMIFNQDGSIQVQMGATEIGQGADTVFVQMAAESTGITEDKIHIVSTQDTDVTPFDTGAYASRQTYVCGKAVKKTGAIFKEKILRYASFMLQIPWKELDVINNNIVRISNNCDFSNKCNHSDIDHNSDSDIDCNCDIDRNSDSHSNNNSGNNGGNNEILLSLEVVGMEAMYSLENCQHITAEATSQCKSNAFATGATFVEVEVDIPLGKIEILNIMNIHDSGTLINPKLARAQVHGGMSMGLGYALGEELLYDKKGKPLNDNLLDYKLPTAMDTPDLQVHFIEIPDESAPYGNKALGEPPAISQAPAIRNAVLHATGVAIDTLPMNPEKLVLKFLDCGLLTNSSHKSTRN